VYCSTGSPSGRGARWWTHPFVLKISFGELQKAWEKYQQTGGVPGVLPECASEEYPGELDKGLALDVQHFGPGFFEDNWVDWTGPSKLPERAASTALKSHPELVASKCIVAGHEPNPAISGVPVQNICDYPVTYEYCVPNVPDSARSCDKGLRALGTLQPHEMQHLLADSRGAVPTLSFMGCRGQASEVSPKLTRYVPPKGRCLQ